MQASIVTGLPTCSHVRLGAARPVVRVVSPVVVQAEPTRRERRLVKHRRIRKKLSGTPERPRMAVFRSNNHIYVQVIDDTIGHTLAAAGTLDKDVKEVTGGNGANKAAAEVVGKKIGEQCLSKNITKVAFDRGGFEYHGRVQMIADAARAAGLQF